MYVLIVHRAHTIEISQNSPNRFALTLVNRRSYRRSRSFAELACTAIHHFFFFERQRDRATVRRSSACKWAPFEVINKLAGCLLLAGCSLTGCLSLSGCPLASWSFGLPLAHWLVGESIQSAASQLRILIRYSFNTIRYTKSAYAHML